MTEGEIRQLRSEARERLADMQDLQRELERQGVGADQLRDVMRSIRAIEQGGYKSREELDALQQQIIQGLKEFEFGLRRRAEGTDKEKLYLTGSDQVPPAYRKVVEEYYRSLSSKKK